LIRFPFSMKKSWFILFLLLCVQPFYAQQKQWKVLFVGNSYTYAYNLPQIVARISEETSLRLDTYQSTLGGARLEDHWKGFRDLNSREMIINGDYDVVVLQDQSMSAMTSPDSTLKYIMLFNELIRSRGAVTCLYSTWARERVPQYQEEIDTMYARAAMQTGAIRVPVGRAWQLAMDLRPSVDLYTSDGSHPNELGTLLTAAMFVRVICGELPETLPTLYTVEDARGETVRLMNHYPEDAEFCRRVANRVAAEMDF
jgi:hypothetical protein